MATTKEEWGAVLSVCYTDPLTDPGPDLSAPVYFALTHSTSFMSWAGATQPSHPLVGAIVETIQSGGAPTVTDVTNRLPVSAASNYVDRAASLDPLVAALLEAM
mgnify:FL=1